MFRQLYVHAVGAHPSAAGSCCLVTAGGEAASTAPQLQAMLQRGAAAAAAEQLLDVDHVRGGSGASVHAVLYGPLGAACTSELLSALDAASPSLRYALRPAMGPGCLGLVGACSRLGTEESRVALPGYGVEAVLKNMEYSAMDDKKAAAAGV